MVTAAAAEKRFYLKTSLLFYLAWILVFEMVGKAAATLPTRDLTLGLDRMIPVAAVFVCPTSSAISFLSCLCFCSRTAPVQPGHPGGHPGQPHGYVVYFALPISYPARVGGSLSTSSSAGNRISTSSRAPTSCPAFMSPSPGSFHRLPETRPEEVDAAPDPGRGRADLRLDPSHQAAHPPRRRLRRPVAFVAWWAAA